MMRIPCSRSSIGGLAMGRRSTMRDAHAPRRKWMMSATTGLTRLLEIIEEMQVVGCDRGLDLRAGGESQIGIDARDPDLAISEPNGEKLLVAQLLGDHDGAFDADLVLVHRRPKANMLRAYADANRSSHARTEIGKPRGRKPELQSLVGQHKMVGFCHHVDGDEIHRRRADEARYEPVGGFAVELERRPHLLHDALLD